MKHAVTFFLLLCSTSLAVADDRYVQEGKVVHEVPKEEDVLRVKASMGFCTVLEFPEKPVMVTVGDNSLLQVEVPKNSRNVVIKPLEESGTTNLFVFTQNKRFNYEIVIGDDDTDYVVDTKSQMSDPGKPKKGISLTNLIKMARNYIVLNEMGTIDKRNFIQKDLFYACAGDGFEVSVIEAFTHRDPHSLILHIVVSNKGERAISLSEQLTKVYVRDRRFTPRYILFDSHRLAVGDKADGWLILENSFVAMDNHFTFGLGIGDKEHVCR